MRTDPVNAQRVDDIEDVRVRAGAFEYYKSGDRYPAGMIFSCPCGCGDLCALQFRPADDPKKASWQWDGNLNEPTLNPSVNWVGHWHGWLRNGVWTSC